MEEEKSYATDMTENSEESGVFQTILSTMCCAGSSSSLTSYSRSNEITGEDDEDVENEPKFFWEAMGSFFLYGIRPVDFIAIRECPSIDGSELTLPRVLARMADRYDRKNANKVLSIIQGDAGVRTGDKTTAVPAALSVSRKPSQQNNSNVSITSKGRHKQRSDTARIVESARSSYNVVKGLKPGEMKKTVSSSRKKFSNKENNGKTYEM